jgi:hypothetical protein
MRPEVIGQLVDVSKQMDPTTASLVRTINALAHNNGVLLAEITRLETELAERDRPERADAPTGKHHP